MNWQSGHWFLEEVKHFPERKIDTYKANKTKEGQRERAEIRLSTLDLDQCVIPAKRNLCFKVSTVLRLQGCFHHEAKYCKSAAVELEHRNSNVDYVCVCVCACVCLRVSDIYNIVYVVPGDGYEEPRLTCWFGELPYTYANSTMAANTQVERTQTPLE